MRSHNKFSKISTIYFFFKKLTFGNEPLKLKRYRNRTNKLLSNKNAIVILNTLYKNLNIKKIPQIIR
jgi:hypothetical protein